LDCSGIPQKVHQSSSDQLFPRFLSPPKIQRDITPNLTPSHSALDDFMSPCDKLSAHAAVIASSCTLSRLAGNQSAGELQLSPDRSPADSRKQQFFHNFWQFSAVFRVGSESDMCEQDVKAISRVFFFAILRM
jgi:hypothetical protein